MAEKFILALILATVQTCVGVSHSLGPWVLGMQKEYKEWSLERVFRAGDTVEFQYRAGVHNVVELSSQEAYDNCDLSKPVKVFNQANAVVTLTTAGKHFYVSGVPGHCDGGMKVTINVASAAEAPASPPAEGKVSWTPKEKYYSAPARSPAPAPAPVRAPWFALKQSTHDKYYKEWSPVPAPTAYSGTHDKYYSSSTTQEWSSVPAPAEAPWSAPEWSSHDTYNSPPSPPQGEWSPVPAPTYWEPYKPSTPRKYGP